MQQADLFGAWQLPAGFAYEPELVTPEDEKALITVIHDLPLREAQLGWHRDVPEFDAIVGVSLAGSCRMRLRPYPPRKGRDPDALAFTLAPRSVYSMRDDSRWRWQHAISPTKHQRYSITFRTMNAAHRP